MNCCKLIHKTKDGMKQDIISWKRNAMDCGKGDMSVDYSHRERLHRVLSPKFGLEGRIGSRLGGR